MSNWGHPHSIASRKKISKGMKKYRKNSSTTSLRQNSILLSPLTPAEGRYLLRHPQITAKTVARVKIIQEGIPIKTNGSNANPQAYPENHKLSSLSSQSK